MSNDLTVNELYELIKHDVEYPCGLDEVLLLLAEFIDNEKVTEEVNKYVDDLYKDLGLGRRSEKDERA